MYYPALVSTQEELMQIIQLQKDNLPENISGKELASQGFVTIKHDLKLLNDMHELAPSVIIKDREKVVAYALTMLRACGGLVNGLVPMFAVFDNLKWNNKPVNDMSYYVMGQVCVSKAYRGQGLFDALYAHHRRIYRSQYDLFLTQISVRNPRSIKAHERVGFKTIHSHRDEQDEWLVVGWDWGPSRIS